MRENCRVGRSVGGGTGAAGRAGERAQQGDCGDGRRDLRDTRPNLLAELQRMGGVRSGKAGRRVVEGSRGAAWRTLGGLLKPEVLRWVGTANSTPR